MSTLHELSNEKFDYKFWRSPAEVRSIDEARQGGLNCIVLAHLAIKYLFDYNLPSNLHCVELFRDEEHFDEVDPIEMEVGDLIWFGRANPKIKPEEFKPVYQADGNVTNWRDNPITHVGIDTGDRQSGVPMILHATHIEGTNTIWPLNRFAEVSRYRRIYAARRLKDQFRQAV